MSHDDGCCVLLDCGDDEGWSSGHCEELGNDSPNQKEGL